MNQKTAICVLAGLSVGLLGSGCRTADSLNADSESSSGLMIDGPVWEMVSYLSVSGSMEPRVDKSMVNLKITDGKISGHAGANTFFGGVELDDTSIKLSPIGSSMMMGTPELMAQEGQFLKLLQLSTRYKIEGDELCLKNEAGRVVLIFVPRVEPSLTSNVWKATGVNNGKGGVTSLLPGSNITAEFTAEGRVSGSAGCNSYSGGYELEGTSIVFSPISSTRKMCAEPAGIMEQEILFLQALEKSDTYSITEGCLELRDASGALHVSFSTGNE